jgi:hypothetical protein
MPGPDMVFLVCYECSRPTGCPIRIGRGSSLGCIQLMSCECLCLVVVMRCCVFDADIFIFARSLLDARIAHPNIDSDSS